MAVWTTFGGMSRQQLTVTQNLVSGNAANLLGPQGYGGGVFVYNIGEGTIQGNQITDNNASATGYGVGGGLSISAVMSDMWQKPTANFVLDGNLARGNLASEEAGGILAWGPDNLQVINNVVANNQAKIGGGISFRGSYPDDPDLHGAAVNNTVVNNYSEGISLLGWFATIGQLVNNIVVSHTVGITVSENSTTTISYTLLHGNAMDIAGSGRITHTNPITGEPGFVDPGAYDYHLTTSSAAWETGDLAGVPPAPDHDAEGVRRPQGQRVDLGAYEWSGGFYYYPVVFSQWKPVVGWMVGDASPANGQTFGTILHTIDSGYTWTRQGSAAEIPNVSLNDVSAVDSQHAWVVGEKTILRTRDAGQSWDTQVLPANLPADFQLLGVKALDADTVYVAGTSSVLLQTNDGVIWSIMPRGADVGEYIAFQVVDAVDAQHVWAVGSEMVNNERTNPVIAFYNGNIWHLQPTGVLAPPISAVIGISAIDTRHAWAVGGFGMPLAFTINGGVTWQVTDQPLNANDTNRVVAVCPTTGWVSGDYGMVRYTNDAGASWSSTNLASEYLFSITAMDDKTAWVVGPGTNGVKPGVIARTVDALNWVVVSDPEWPNLFGISFVGARK